MGGTRIPDPVRVTHCNLRQGLSAPEATPAAVDLARASQKLPFVQAGSGVTCAQSRRGSDRLPRRKTLRARSVSGRADPVIRFVIALSPSQRRGRTGSVRRARPGPPGAARRTPPATGRASSQTGHRAAEAGARKAQPLREGPSPPCPRVRRRARQPRVDDLTHRVAKLRSGAHNAGRGRRKPSSPYGPGDGPLPG
jgi:hypothetical protein